MYIYIYLYLCIYIRLLHIIYEDTLKRRQLSKIFCNLFPSHAHANEALKWMKHFKLTKYCQF